MVACYYVFFYPRKALAVLTDNAKQICPSFLTLKSCYLAWDFKAGLGNVNCV